MQYLHTFVVVQYPHTFVVVQYLHTFVVVQYLHTFTCARVHRPRNEGAYCTERVGENNAISPQNLLN